MDVINAKIQQLQSVQDNWDTIILDLIRDFEEEVIDLNTMQLSESGIDSNGEEITPGYRPLTVSIKTALGQPTDRVTLKNEGDFHNAWFIVYGRNYFAMGSDDEKAGKLEGKYGSAIYGLTDENIQEVIDMIKPDLIEEVKKRI